MPSVFDHFTIKTQQKFLDIQDTIKSLNKKIPMKSSDISLPLNASPKASLKKLQKEMAEEVAQVKTLSSGNAFNTIDLSARLVEVENATKSVKKKPVAKQEQ